jgi:hypothetical protein
MEIMAKKRRQGRASGAQPSPAPTLEIPYKRHADFRFIPADGAVVRVQPNGVVLGFYVDDVRVVSQTGELIETQGAIATYKAGPLKEEMGRVEQVSVRMTHADALSVAALIQQKMQEVQAAVKSGEQMPEPKAGSK